ncbi:copper homeostasis protein CutC [Mediterraneibacter glycyrrhizinilyticus]|nr:copper homeostasis protein CutC [Mediterraneibacter glycyrrhizinilyticus]MBM6854192.1 copper homeostasis protein CutC [Mediterraneibacter glycyrrhizinilyticus]
MSKYILEACVDSVRSAIEAEKGGASRVELCSDLVIGGVSPSIPLFRQIRKYTDLRIRVLLRPRYGDYCYDSYEFEELKEEVSLFREEGADGVVVGILNPDGTLNTEQLSELKQEAGSMEITLHRAFDVCADPFQALEQAVEMGFDTILTSGQAPTAWEGRDLLRELQKKSRGRIEILAASGIGPEPIRNLIPFTGISSYHMSGKAELESAMTFRKKGIGLGLSESSDYKILRTDSHEIRTSVALLKQAFGS